MTCTFVRPDVCTLMPRTKPQAIDSTDSNRTINQSGRGHSDEPSGLVYGLVAAASNHVADSMIGNLVQAGAIQGGVHCHPQAARSWPAVAVLDRGARIVGHPPAGVA